jgi:uncharacterized membrane protein
VLTKSLFLNGQDSIWGIVISLESGRKLGLTGSLIEIIMPAAIVATVIFFIWSIFATLVETSNPTIPNFLSISIGFIATFILLGIITFVGIILFIIGMHRLSQYYSEPSIFKNVLYGFILNIIGSVTATVIEFTFILESIRSVSQTGTTPVVATVESVVSPEASVSTTLVLGYYAALAIGLVLGIISAVLYMRAFNKLAEKSGKDNFRTAGLLYLLGTVLTIVLIGGLLVWIAWIFAATGFNSLKPREPSATKPQIPPPPPM